MLPWSDAIPFGRYLFINLPILEWLAIPSLPVFIIERSVPFGSLLVFFGLFIGLVRNPNAPYFLKFNTLQAILIDIIIILISYAFRVLIEPINNGLLLETLYSCIFLASLVIIIFTGVECIQGKEPDLPWISEAVRIQV